jgi:hypothetical protein
VNVVAPTTDVGLVKADGAVIPAVVVPADPR